MERIALVLPKIAMPGWFRIACTTCITILCCAIQWVLTSYVGSLTLFVLLAGIFVVGTVFDRGQSFYALALGTFIIVLLSPSRLEPRFLVPMVVFVLIGI